MADEPLPKLVPERPSPDLTLGWNGDGFLLESETEMIVARPDWHLLARWWINGEPFSPRLAEELADANGLVVEGKKIAVDLLFDPGEFGASPGDRVGLQVMHLPNGWTYSQHAEVLQHAMREQAGYPQPRMSNRIEFVVP